VVDVESGFSFKTKFERFNSGVNPDFGANFSYHPEITPKYEIPNLCATFVYGLTLVSSLNSMLNFGF